MSEKTYLHVSNKITFDKAVVLVENVLDVKAVAKFSADIGHGWIGFEYDGIRRDMTFVTHCHEPELTKETVNVFGLGAYGSSVEIMTKLGRAIGGWLEDSDVRGEPYYIEREEPIEEKVEIVEPDNRQKLRALFAEKFGYETAESVVEFLAENKAAILELDFGIASSQSTSRL